MDTKSPYDTPLMIACRRGYIDIVRYCLSKGAKNDPHPDFGQTALHVAVVAKHYGIVKMILDVAAQSDADSIICNLTDHPMLHTPLHIAVMTIGIDDIVEILLQHGADISAVNNKNQTVLHLCCLHGNDRALGILLDHGGDEFLEFVDNVGQTCLHCAVLGSNIRCVRLLLETAADVSTTDNFNQTAYLIAISLGLNDIIEILLEYAAPIPPPVAPPTILSRSSSNNLTLMPPLPPTFNQPKRMSPSISSSPPIALNSPNVNPYALPRPHSVSTQLSKVQVYENTSISSSSSYHGYEQPSMERPHRSHSFHFENDYNRQSDSQNSSPRYGASGIYQQQPISAGPSPKAIGSRSSSESSFQFTNQLNSPTDHVGINAPSMTSTQHQQEAVHPLYARRNSLVELDTPLTMNPLSQPHSSVPSLLTKIYDHFTKPAPAPMNPTQPTALFNRSFREATPPNLRKPSNKQIAPMSPLDLNKVDILPAEDEQSESDDENHSELAGVADGLVHEYFTATKRSDGVINEATEVDESDPQPTSSEDPIEVFYYYDEEWHVYSILYEDKDSTIAPYYYNYYYNAITQHSQWKDPRHVGLIEYKETETVTTMSLNNQEQQQSVSQYDAQQSPPKEVGHNIGQYHDVTSEEQQISSGGMPITATEDDIQLGDIYHNSPL